MTQESMKLDLKKIISDLQGLSSKLDRMDGECEIAHVAMYADQLRNIAEEIKADIDEEDVEDETPEDEDEDDDWGDDEDDMDDDDSDCCEDEE